MRVPGNQVVIVRGGEIDQLLLPRLAQDVGDFHRGDPVHDGSPEWVSHGIGHAPEGHRKLAVLHRVVSPSVAGGSQASHLFESQENMRVIERGLPHFTQRRRNGSTRRRCQTTHGNGTRGNQHEPVIAHAVAAEHPRGHPTADDHHGQRQGGNPLARAGLLELPLVQVERPQGDHRDQEDLLEEHGNGGLFHWRGSVKGTKRRGQLVNCRAGNCRAVVRGNCRRGTVRGYLGVMPSEPGPLIIINDGERTSCGRRKAGRCCSAQWRRRSSSRPRAAGGRAAGSAACGCLSGAPDHVPEERAVLSAEEMARGVHFACQLNVRGETRIELPSVSLARGNTPPCCPDPRPRAGHARGGARP